MSEKLKMKCPNCGETVEVTIQKVSQKTISIEDLKQAMKEWIDQVDIDESKDSFVVAPKEFLGKQLWYQINSVLEKIGAEWVSAGKESRWIIEKA